MRNLKPSGEVFEYSPDTDVNVFECHDLVDLVQAVGVINQRPKWYRCVECLELIDRSNPEDIAPNGYPVVVWFVDSPYHRRCAPRCERCGEHVNQEMALVADGLVHVVCMEPGEEIV